MSPVVRILFALLLLCLATACEMNRVLTIKPDGSGRIDERVLAPRDSYRTEIKPGEPASVKMGLEPPTAANIAKRAAGYGEGVELTSFKKIEEGDMLGYEAAYTFPDVAKLNVRTFVQSEDPSTALAPDSAHAKPPLRFQFTKGAVSELRLPLEKEKASATDDKNSTATQNDDPKQREQMIEALKHLNLRVAIHVDGTIESTNAHFRDGNDLVIQEMNFKGMAANPKYADLFKDDGKTPLPKEPPSDERYYKEESVDVLNIRFK